MVELLRSNDIVYLCWVKAVLEEAEIDVVHLDQHMSCLEGSVNAIEQRLLVAEDDLSKARYHLSIAKASLSS